VLLPSTAGTSRVPQPGDAAASACSTVVPALAREKFFHNSFDLFRERFLSQLLSQFGLQLRCDQGEEFGVVCQEGPIDIRFIKKAIKNVESEHAYMCEWLGRSQVPDAQVMGRAPARSRHDGPRNYPGRFNSN
jgi:hypothetical protein